MTEIIEIKTKRLLMRQWRSRDFELFARINSNQKVMQFFPDILTQQQSDDMAHQIQHNIKTNGWGFWAIEIPGECEFIGFVGLNAPSYELPFDNHKPLVEIGWRLSDDYWGKGYATEAARSALEVGFNKLKLSEIFSFASVLNLASISVMKRLKLQNTNYVFNHPKILQDHELQKHCLYKINKDAWLSS